jgi:hypothetical protein
MLNNKQGFMFKKSLGKIIFSSLIPPQSSPFVSVAAMKFRHKENCSTLP